MDMTENQETEWINDDPLAERFKSWVETTRIQTAMVTALALWIGYVTVASIDFTSAIVLGSVGVLVHIWGFTLNEVEDYKYDREHGEAEGHPIAQGKVHADSARVLAWISAVLAVVTLTLSNASMSSVVVLLLSFVPGAAYDKWSKKHWWANGYLSIWAMMMVLTGALYAGLPTIYTGIIATAVGIQIFVQVIQGDLKDISGAENTFAEVCGVKRSIVARDILNIQSSNEDSSMEVLMYSNLFSGIIYGLKLFEAILIFMLVIMTLDNFGALAPLWAGLAFIVGIAFMTTTSMFLVYVYDRDEIKKKSSVHELISVLLLGLAVVGLDTQGAFLIMAAPIVWYLASNRVLHSSALNPDI